MRRDNLKRSWPIVLLPVLVIIIFVLLLQNAYLKGSHEQLSGDLDKLQNTIEATLRAAERAENEAKIDRNADGTESRGVEGAAPRSEPGEPTTEGNQSAPAAPEQGAPEPKPAPAPQSRAEPAPEAKPREPAPEPNPPLLCRVIEPLC